MFTKCPECNISFRVTAKVLQQANGNVRCGGCGHAFSALDYLSEEMPNAGPDASESSDSDELAETSRRLLETLDELAGPEEVRIEDTGMEWRVLDKDGDSDSAEDVNVTEEMRYDDSTLLPDDFGKKAEENDASREPGRRASDLEDERSAEFEAAQKDLSLSEPGDWTDLLDEVRGGQPEAESLEVEEELAAIHNQLSAREDSATQDVRPADINSQFDTQAEAMGLEITASEDALTDQFPLLNEDDIEDPVNPDDDESGDLKIYENEADEETGEFKIEDLDDDSGEDDDVSVTDPANQNSDEDEEDPTKKIESTGEFQSQIDVAARALAGEDDADQIADEETEIRDEISAEHDEDDDVELELEGEASAGDDSSEIEHFVPPQTEEEMTVNQEIDQEMMALATQDDDFTATLVGLKSPEELFEENAEDVETIIMEGEFIRGSVDKERLAAEQAAKSQLDDPGKLVDTYAMRRGKVRGGRRRYDPTGYGVTIGAIVLALGLAGQFIHNSRETFATIGLFNQTIAPVYRMLGNPVTPSWDIKGWQFEATNGNVDETETALTIVSRIVNRAEQPLPYPLVHVSLTDRWEEIMGSRILEPGDYLAGDLDPSSPVLPGENFTAVITIENPSVEATGFKLNVCYRVSAGTVRCAIEDFKN